MVSGYGGMSISQIVDSVKGGTAGFRGGGPRGGGPGGRSTKTKKSSGSGASDSLPISGRGAELAARAAYNAGFRGEDLFKIVSIAGRESGFDPNAINKSSRDTGMWQIAPMNWGSYSQEDLLDPANNAAAAFRLFKGSGFHGWKAANSRMKNSAGHWVVDPSGKGGAGWASDGNELWKTESHQATARVAVESITGDPAGGGSRAPVMQHRGPSSAMQTPLVMSPTYNISVAPVIQFQGGGSSPSHSDLKKMAQTVGVMLKEEVRTLSLRTE